MKQADIEAIESEILEQITTADSMFEEGEYRSAALIYLRVAQRIRSYQEYPHVVFNLVFSLRNLALYEQAIKVLDKHPTAFPRHKTMEMKADIFREMDPKKAITLYDNVIKLKKDHIRAYVRKAEILHEMGPKKNRGEIARTLKAGKKNLRMEDTLDVAILARAYRTLMDDMKTAKELIEGPLNRQSSLAGMVMRTFKGNTEFVEEYWMERAEIYEDPEETLRSLNNALSLNERNADAWEMKGDLMYSQDKLAEAREYYQQVLRIKHSNEVQKKLVEIGGS